MAGFVKSALKLFGLSEEGGRVPVGPVKSLDDFLTELPQFMPYDINFKKNDSDSDGTHYEVVGTEAKEFLGDSAEMLDALAHLSMRVLRREKGVSNEPGKEGDTTLRVTFDCDGFRSNKAGELRKLAEDLRLKVIEAGGKPSYVKALSPSDRKIIHTHLVTLGDVVSESIGKGTFKRIRIRLVDDSPHRKEGERQPRGDRQPGERQAGDRQPGQGGGDRGGRGGRGGRGRGGQGRGPRQGNGGGRPMHARNGQFNGPNGNQAPHTDDDFGNRAPAIESQEETMIDDDIGNRVDPRNRGSH